MNELPQKVESSEITISALKNKLDEIDKTVYQLAYDGFYGSRLAILIGMWRKGKEISLYRGVKGEISYRQLEIETGKKQENLKKWNDLYEKYPRRKDYQKIAEPLAESWTQKALGLKPNLPAAIPLPIGEFSVIYADPPWKYDFSETTSREIESKYPTMTVEQIASMEIPSAENAVLFLWATAPKLLEALEIIKAWGFSYRTNAVWDKEIIGMGYWFRGQHEFLLVGTKGNVSPPEQSARVSSVIRQKRSEHSKKPGITYEIIEKMFPNQKRIELFARNEREGWESWGNEL